MIVEHLGQSFSPFHYGLFELKMDTSSLSSGLVRVLKAKGFFQDGLFFNFDATKDNPLELNLNTYFQTNSKAIKIYLSIPSRHCGENALMGGFTRYYSSEILDIKDENIGENEINIPILKPNLKLLDESQVDGRYQSFPIFEVEKSTDRGIVSTNFIAPFLTLSEHSQISSMCRDIVGAIREKISYFAERKENFTQNSAEESIANLRLLIQAALPLESIIKIEGLHPFEIFKCFLNSIASIIAINPAGLVYKLPVYNHNDIYNCFEQLYNYSIELLQHLKQKYDVIKFQKDNNVFSLNIIPEWLKNDEIVIGIRKPFAVSNDDMLSWINGLQIASTSTFPLIKDKRVLGAERRILERSEYITQPIGMISIAIKAHTSYIKPNEKLYLSSSYFDIIPEEIILYAEK